MTDDGGNETAGDGGGDGTAHPARDGEGTARAHATRTRSTLSADGAYALLWGVVSLLAAALSFDGSVDLVVALAGIAGAVGVYAVARDLLRGQPPSGFEFLWMGTAALLAAGVAALGGRLLVAGGLGVVAIATLVEGYGWFGAGRDEADEGIGNESAGNAENADGNEES